MFGENFFNSISEGDVRELLGHDVVKTYLPTSVLR